MKKEWIYKGRKHVIYSDGSGHLFLDGFMYDCNDILEDLDSPDPLVVEAAKKRADLAIIEHQKKRI